jgi:hypothetical protein
MVTDEEKERHVVQCEAMCGASSGEVTAAEHSRLCLHKYAPQGRDSGVAEGVHRAKMKKRASEKSKLSTSNGEIPNVAAETCLGHAFSADGNSRVALDHRIAKATGSFNSLHPVWKHPNLSLKHKLMIYEGSTSLCLLWGGEAWVWDQVHKGLNSFNAGCLSRFTGRSRVEEAKDPSINIKNLLTRRQLSFLGRKLRGPPTASALRAILARLTPVEGTVKVSSHGGKEMPSCTHAHETQRARTEEYMAAFGPCPEDVDFTMDRNTESHRESIFRWCNYDTFGELMEAAQDKAEWTAAVKKAHPSRRLT